MCPPSTIIYNDLGLDVASSLLNKTEVNHGLKLVYIARDPRALVNSRWAKIWNKIQTPSFEIILKKAVPKCGLMESKIFNLSEFVTFLAHQKIIDYIENGV